MNRRTVLRAAAALALSPGAVACGLRADGAPRDIPAADQPADTEASNTGSISPQVGGDARIFMLDGNSTTQARSLRAVRRNVANTAAARMQALLAGPSQSERASRIRSAIPPGTRLLSADSRRNGLVVVDLSEDFVAVSDDVLVDAVAQVVFTLSEVQDAADVQILIRGQLKDLPRGDRSLTASPLTIFDFPGSRASTQPDLPPVPSPTLPASTVAVATTTT